MQQFPCAVLFAPVLKIFPVQRFVGLNEQHTFDVFNVFRALSLFAPSQFGDDDILGGGDEHGPAADLSGDAAFES